jgi:hypothetical protein
MTAPNPPSSNLAQNHLAKRAPSRHDITVQSLKKNLRCIVCGSREMNMIGARNKLRDCPTYFALSCAMSNNGLVRLGRSPSHIQFQTSLWA